MLDNRKKYDPKFLPEIDSIEIVDLRRLAPNRVNEYMKIAKGEPCTRCDGETASALAQLWRELVPGQSKRCHSPPLGFRFFLDGEVILEASVCWRCNNLFGFESGLEISYTFDGESEEAISLLSAAKKIIGIEQF